MADAVPFGVCIIGTGQIAEDMKKAIRGTKETAKVYLATVGSRSLEKATKFLADYKNHAGLPSPIPFGTYEEAINHPSVHGVYISVPTGVEEPVVMQALEAGKHVLADKPFVNVAMVQRMGRKAAEKGLLLMDATHFVHNPRTEALRDYVRLSNMRTLIAVFCAGPKSSDDIRFHNDLEPLGAIGDLGWYTARAAVEFLTQSPIKSVQALNVQPTEQGRTIAHGHAIVEFEDGRVLMSLAKFGVPWDQSLKLVADDRIIKVDDFVVDHHNSGIYEHPERKTQFIVTPAQELERTQTVTVENDRPSYSRMFETFASDSHDKSRHPYWLERTVRTQAIVDAMFTGRLDK